MPLRNLHTSLDASPIVPPLDPNPIMPYKDRFLLDNRWLSQPSQARYLPVKS